MSTIESDFKKYEVSYRQYYGENYDKALRNLRSTKESLKNSFKKNYPNANIKLFSFNITLSKSGDVTGTSVSFKVRSRRTVSRHYNKRIQRVILRGVVLVAKNMGDYRYGPTVRKEPIEFKREFV